MKVCGIVAEYNPFHSGHLYHIRRSRQEIKALFDEDAAIVAVMSGNVAERGDLAVFRKHARARAALSVKDGADLVIELPTPFSCATAERFALSAVSLLAATGVVNCLSFGSETGCIAPLQNLARLHEDPEFSERVREELKKGVTYAAARQRAAEAMLGDEGKLLKLPNCILGVEYIRALSRFSREIAPIAIERVGPGHDEREIKNETASASRLRDMLLSGDMDGAMRYMPEGAAEAAAEEIARGRGPVSITALDTAVMAHLRRLSLWDFENLPDVSEGLPGRLLNAVRESNTFEEAIFKAKTKRYTLARIRRQLLLAFLGVCREDAEGPPPYIRVLGFTERGRELLRRMKKSASLPVLIKPAEVRKLSARAERVFSIEARVSDIYRLACPSLGERSAGSEYRDSPVFVRR